MPIYEFFSPTKGKIYSFFARSTSFSNKTPSCPDGKKNEMKSDEDDAEDANAPEGGDDDLGIEI